MSEPRSVPEKSTVPFSLLATFGGVPWDITGATVTLIFRSPAGVETAKTATVLSGPDGTAQYVTLTTDLVATARRERWTRSWRVQKSGVDERSLPIPFFLVDSP